MHTAKTIFLLFVFFCTASKGFSQKNIKGTITDAKTGETLVATNILVKDTYRGTITNTDGQYALTIPDSLLPATIVVRYIGYESQERAITRSSEEGQDFKLQPSMVEMEEITVTGEDPAVRIMREVIRRKQQWRKELNTYQGEAYTRQTLSNDTAIVMITETVSEVFWDKEEGHREVLKSRKQTANLQPDQNFAGVGYLPNFYDDNIEIAGFDLVGVTHPDALKFYEFKLTGRETLDRKVVYEIKVTPDRKLQPLFEGTIHVLDEEYALLEVNLRPNKVVKFPPPVKDFNTDYKQQFNNYGKAYWLPVDVRIGGEVKISMIGLEFPLIQFRQVSRITNYRINIELPDSLYEKKELFSVDSTTINNDSLFVKAIDSVPLSEEEEEAYTKLDSTQTLEKAFKPTGFLARFIDDENEGDGDSDGSSGPGFLSKIPGSLAPAVRYNRVDELYAGLKYSFSPVDDLQLRFSGGYSTGYDKWSYGAGFTYKLYQERIAQQVGIDYKARTSTRYTSEIYETFSTIAANLIGEKNYFDYFRNEGWRAFTKLTYPRADLSFTAGFNSEDHTSLETQTAYDILGRDQTPLVNPPIDEGRLNSVDITAGYNLDEDYTLGLTSLKRVAFYLEHSEGSLGSDFDFTRYTASIDWSFNTFYKRRFLPNRLDVKLSAGTYSGDLPFQRYGIIDVAPGIFNLYGSLRTKRNRPYQGEQYISMVAEHNFRTIPFELLGIQPLVDRDWGIIVFGGVGKTWFSENRRQALMDNFGYNPTVADDVHLEAGFSINRILGLFRMDIAQRLDEPAFLIGFSLGRVF